MKSTRRWFYLTGSLTVLVLALMGVLWAMTVAAAPPNATELSEGTVTTDVDVVGPTLTNAADRTVKVTLTNAALNKTEYVGAGPNNELSAIDINGDGDKDDDDDSLRIVMPGAVQIGDRFRVQLINPVTDFVGEDDYTLPELSRTSPDPVTAAAILPIVDRNSDGSVTVADIEIVDDGDVETDTGQTAVDGAQVELIRILNAATGVMLFESKQPLVANSVFALRFATSPQETALVNVRGDNDNFDLLTVESAAGPAGAYSATFVADEEIVIHLSPTAPATNSALNGIMHEQHNVPAGLRGNVEIEDERIRLTQADLDRDGDGNATTVDIVVRNAPIRVDNPTSGTIVAVPIADIDVDPGSVSVTAEVSIEDATAGVIGLTTTDTDGFAVDDIIEVSYIGSDNFTIQLEHAPVLDPIDPDGADNVDGVNTTTDPPSEDDEIVIPSNTDGVEGFGKYFAIVSQDASTGAVKIGVTVGGGDDRDDRNKALPAHITVLGVSYDGSETVEIRNSSIARSSGDGLQTGDFTVNLDFEPQDADGNNMINAADITIVAGGNAGDIVTGGTLAVLSVTADSRSVTFGFRADAATQSTVTLDDIPPASGTSTFGVAYAVSVGANPKNALRPGAEDRPVIQVEKGSRVAVTSDDERATVDAEADGPTFSNASPASGSATNELDQVLSVDITDALAGLDAQSIRFFVSTSADDMVPDGTADDRDAHNATYGDVRGESISTTTNGDVVTASVALDDLEDDLTTLSIDEDGVTIVYWRVFASDKADNLGVTDANADMDGSQPFMLRVDNEAPTLEAAYVGDNWNATANVDADDDKGAIVGDRRLKVDDYLPGSSKGNMIRVEFDEILNGDSVAATDFEVTLDGADLAIAGASWYNASNDDRTLKSGDDTMTNDDAPVVKNSVFLEMAEALAADATPTVTLVGSIEDAAGNSVSSGSAEAADGIAPTATVSVDMALSDGEVAVMVQTDERIRTLEPDLMLYYSTNANAGDGMDDDMEAVGVSIPRSSRTAGMNEWTFNLDIDESKKYSVVVNVEDSARNQSTVGKMDWADSGSISFEIDTEIGVGDNLTTRPEGGAEATMAEPFFIEINWLSEAGEYVGDSQKSVSLTKAVLDAGTANERDLLDATSTRDGQIWTVAVTGIGLGEHTLTYNAEDSAGNTLDDDRTLTFEVVDRPMFKLGLNPGLNLISLPGDPIDKNINAVFGDHAAVDLVYTRSGDLWLVAQRSADTGMFEPTGAISDLTSIDSSHAYFVRANASVTVGVDISARGALQVPPSIQVKGGQWNLVPVISLLPVDKISLGSRLDADTYLGSETWSRAFTFQRGQWVGVVPNDSTIHQCVNPDSATKATAGEDGELGNADDGTEANNGACGTQDPNNSGEYFTGSVAGQTDDAVEIGRGYWVWFTKDSTITP